VNISSGALYPFIHRGNISELATKNFSKESCFPTQHLRQASQQSLPPAIPSALILHLFSRRPHRSIRLATLVNIAGPQIALVNSEGFRSTRHKWCCVALPVLPGLGRHSSSSSVLRHILGPTTCLTFCSEPLKSDVLIHLHCVPQLILPVFRPPKLVLEPL
jgi:hypothetical protein